MFKTIILLTALCAANTAFSQNTVVNDLKNNGPSRSADDTEIIVAKKEDLFLKVSETYYSRSEGTTLSEIVNRALANNGEIQIARLEIDKAKARLDQAGRRANPTLDVQQSSGRLTGSPGESELSLGISMPLDVNSERKRRVDVARIDVLTREAELFSRQRDLTGRILRIYAETLSALNEIQVLDDLIGLDTRTVAMVQMRVNEGEVSPLELSLLQTEVERLRAKRSLAEAKLQTSLSNLKFFAGISHDTPLKLREEISTAQIPLLPATLEASLALALISRPEVRLAELEASAASANLRLLRSQSRPDVTAFVGYTQGRTAFDDPRGAFYQKDKSMVFGVSVGLNVFDRKQGSKAETHIAITQANERKAYAEAVIRNEVATLVQRIISLDRAATAFRSIVLPRSQNNVETIRQVYEIGEMKITDLIAEQRKLLEANRDLTETLTEKYSAQADLFIALGLQFEK